MDIKMVTDNANRERKARDPDTLFMTLTMIWRLVRVQGIISSPSKPYRDGADNKQKQDHFHRVEPG